MICIAAFIILAIVVLSLPVIRLFSRPAADKIWSLFKKSLHCFTRRATLRKCDTNFKDDIKNSILRKVVIRHPKRVKLVSALIEAGAVAIVVISVWSLAVGLRSLTFLYVYGTCDPADPKSCALASSSAVKSCPIGESSGPNFLQNPLGWTGDWFGRWGTALSLIPDRLKTWDAKEFLPAKNDLASSKNAFYTKYDAKKPVALDVFEPGCTYCRMEFAQQQRSGFFASHNVALAVYVKPGDKHGHEFENSYVVASYIEAVRENSLASDKIKRQKGENLPDNAAWLIVHRLFAENDPETGHPWQDTFGSLYSNTYGSYGRLFSQSEAKTELNKWLANFGYSADEVAKIAKIAASPETKTAIQKNMDVVDRDIRAQALPTVIANGRRTSGLQTK